MGLPQVLVHRMDASSPLIPKKEWYDAEGRKFPGVKRTQDREETRDEKTLEADNLEFAQETKTIESFLLDRDTEIVVLLEGIDEFTGTPIQTRHSYTFEELSWNTRFRPCTFPYTEDLNGTRRTRRRRGYPPVCVVDFSRFHETLPAPVDVDSCPYLCG